MVDLAKSGPRYAFVYLIDTDENSGTPPINRKKNFKVCRNLVL